METKSFKEIVPIKKVVFWAYKFCKQAVTPQINVCLARVWEGSLARR